MVFSMVILCRTYISVKPEYHEERGIQFELLIRKEISIIKLLHQVSTAEDFMIRYRIN